MCPPKKCAVSRKNKSTPPKKSGACQKNKSNSRKKMELLKKQVEAAKHCLHITKKFESAKTIAGACYKKKQRFAKHICHYFKSCTMVQPVMLAYIYIYMIVIFIVIIFIIYYIASSFTQSYSLQFLPKLSSVILSLSFCPSCRSSL